MYVAHRGLNVIVSSDILQRKGIRVLSSLGQKSMTQSVQAGIGMGLDLLPYLAYLFLQHPGAREALSDPAGCEDIIALRVFQKPFEYFLHFGIDHQLALSGSPFQTALIMSSPQIFPSARCSEWNRTQSFISFSISLRQIPEWRARMEADRKGSAAREVHCAYSAAVNM